MNQTKKKKRTVQRLCTYCKKQTPQEKTSNPDWENQSFVCTVCGMESMNIQGFHEALM